MLNDAKLVIYGAIIAGYAAAGVIDLSQGEKKLGVLALLFGVVNAVIFFWRSG